MQSNFRDLKVWNVAMDLAVVIYDLTAKLPDSEKFGLVSQMRRACVSISSNITEGSGRGSKPQFSQFLGFAQGSAFELETQLLLVERMNLLSSNDIKEAIDLLHYIQKMNFKLKQSLSKK
jgi:four helix bundle protein